mgnify:CR=1 FL=1
MAREIQSKDTTRAMAYELWMKAPNPMVTFFKTLDVTNLVKVSKKKNLKFNMLMDYCIVIIFCIQCDMGKQSH